METWKDIPGYEDKYQVSDLGNVKSINFNNTNKEALLKPSCDKDNRLSVSLWKNNKSKTLRIHQLVSMAFLNHVPDKSLTIVVDHKDNNSLNNKLENLQLVTNRFNTSKDKKNKTSKFTGVTWDKKNNKWLSQIKISGKSINLGRYLEEYKAGEAYIKKLSELNKSC